MGCVAPAGLSLVPEAGVYAFEVIPFSATRAFIGSGCKHWSSRQCWFRALRCATIALFNGVIVILPAIYGHALSCIWAPDCLTQLTIKSIRGTPIDLCSLGGLTK